MLDIPLPPSGRGFTVRVSGHIEGTSQSADDEGDASLKTEHLEDPSPMKRILIMLLLGVSLSATPAWSAGQSADLNQTLQELKKANEELKQLTDTMKQANDDMARLSFDVTGMTHAMGRPCQLDALNQRELAAMKRNLKAHGYSDQQLTQFMAVYQASYAKTLKGPYLKKPENQICPAEKRKRLIQSGENAISKLDADSRQSQPARTQK
jgi:cell division protein FtsB